MTYPAAAVFADAWKRAFGSAPIGVKDLRRAARLVDPKTGEPVHSSLRSALLSIGYSPISKKVSWRTVSWWLRKHEGAALEDAKFVRVEGGGKYASWRIVGLDDAAFALPVRATTNVF